MQASQSNNASDLLKPDAQLDSTFHRSFPSPFSSPIHAARKYLERQRGDTSQAGAQETEAALQEEPPLRVGPSLRDRNRHLQEEKVRERDRRLERSLYEVHSIEAALNYEDDLTSDAENAPTERAYFADGDGSEPLFPYAVPGLLPDPGAVRGAILRLTQASEWRRDSPPVSGGNRRVYGGENTPETEPVPQFNFGDVARRVWGEDIAMPRAGSHAEPGLQVEPGLDQSANGAERSRPKTAAAAGCDVEQEPALAHDARNLLSALTLYSDLLGSPGVLEERYSHYAGDLKLVAARSQVLIDRLLRVSASPSQRVEESSGAGRDTVLAGTAAWVESEHCLIKPVPAGEPLPPARSTPIERQAESTSMVDLLMRWGGLLSTLAHGTLDVVFGTDAATPIPIGAEAMERILVNLVRNARAATIEGGAIRICVGLAEPRMPEPRTPEPRTPEYGSDAIEEVASENRTASPRNQHRDVSTLRTMVMTVDDSGCGMTELRIKGILGRDEDSRRSATIDGPRRGLGLQIVRELVAVSGGKLSIQSCVGRGTRIEMCWPVLAAEATGTPVEGSVKAPPSILSANPPIAVVPPTQTGPALEETKEEVGPDGFSEADLRGMMLRLHRTAPQERNPLSRRLNGRQAGTRDADRGFGVVASRSQGALQNSSAQKDAPVKGAIAC